MKFCRRFFHPVAAILAFLAAPAAASAQDWVARGICTALDFHAVTFSDPENVFVVGEGYILHSGDGGDSWAPLLGVNRPLRDVRFRGPSLGLAVGDGGLILRTTDGGQSWSEVENNLAVDLRTVALCDGGMAIAAGFNGVLRSLDGGATWSLADAGDFNFLASAASGNRAWLVGGEHGIVRATTDGGLSWETQSSGTTEDLRGVFFISASQGWIAGAGGTVLYTEDGGSTWLPRGAGVGASLNSIHFVSPTTGWVVGSGGAIFRTDDAGLTWVAESSFSADELFDVSFSSAGQGCAVGVVCTVLLRRSLVTAVIDAIAPQGPVVRPLANPARTVATIRFGVPKDGLVRLKVFDVQGRLAAKLVEVRLPAGWHEARWSAGGRAPGIYLARLEAGGATASTKIVLGR